MGIFEAASNGNEEEVSRLLDEDPTVIEMEDGNGGRPLIFAADNVELGMVKLLVHRGADVNVIGYCGRTPLHWAAGNGQNEMVTFLLRHGAQSDIRDMGGKTALRLAFDEGHAGVLRVLLQHMGEEGLQEMREMRWTPFLEASGCGDLEVVQRLVEDMREQGLEETDRWGRTAFQWATRGGHDEVVALLLDKGVRTDIRDREYETSLMMASGLGHRGVVQVLLEHMEGQGLDRTDRYGMTALNHAARGGHDEVVDLLLERGAQTSIKDRFGRTALMEAADVLKVVQRLVGHMGTQRLEEKDQEGKTALHWAAYQGSAAVVSFLLSQGAQASSRDGKDRTALMVAADEGEVGVVKVLAQHEGGRGLNDRCVDGTALHLAVVGGHHEVVRALLLAGTDTTITENEGRTPRALAQEQNEDGACAEVFEVSMRQNNSILHRMHACFVIQAS